MVAEHDRQLAHLHRPIGGGRGLFSRCERLELARLREQLREPRVAEVDERRAARAERRREAEKEQLVAGSLLADEQDPLPSECRRVARAKLAPAGAFGQRGLLRAARIRRPALREPPAGEQRVREVERCVRKRGLESQRFPDGDDRAFGVAVLAQELADEVPVLRRRCQLDTTPRRRERGFAPAVAPMTEGEAQVAFRGCRLVSDERPRAGFCFGDAARGVEHAGEVLARVAPARLDRQRLAEARLGALELARAVERDAEIVEDVRRTAAQLRRALRAWRSRRGDGVRPG